MNSAQIHLALTHVPVILSLVGLILLIIALLRKSNSLVKTSYYILLFAGLSVIPVYLSGEGSEELVERLPGVSESIIEEHEEVAKLGMISIVVAGLGALAGLFMLNRRSVTPPIQSSDPAPGHFFRRPAGTNRTPGWTNQAYRDQEWLFSTRWGRH